VAIDRAGLGRLADDDALTVWRELLDGGWTLVAQLERGGRRYLVARRGAARGDGLTRAEMVCAIYAARGYAQKWIAYELGIGEPTVSTHVRRAMRKLGVVCRAELAAVFGAARCLAEPSTIASFIAERGTPRASPLGGGGR
jgi:DNA-binding CsgD family transcriptional regulator